MSDTFATPCTVALQAPLSMGFPRQEYWSGLPFPSPGVVLDPETEPGSHRIGPRLTPLSIPESQPVFSHHTGSARVLSSVFTPFSAC